MNIIITIISFFISLFVILANQGLVKGLYKYDSFEIIFNQSVLFIPIFIFSFITIFAPERVFASWWKFARIAIPVTFVFLLVINSDLLLSETEQWPDLVNIPAFTLVYGTFILGSAWSIWKGWRNK